MWLLWNTTCLYPFLRVRHHNTVLNKPDPLFFLSKRTNKQGNVECVASSESFNSDLTCSTPSCGLGVLAQFAKFFQCYDSPSTTNSFLLMNNHSDV